MDLNIVLLHEQMVNKEGRLVTTSLTLNDIQDLARCARTYGVRDLYIAHPSPALQKLARRLMHHWEKGYGAAYNPKRRDALSTVKIVADLDQAITEIDLRAKALPKLIGTSARPGIDRITFKGLRQEMEGSENPYLIMLGTGWGMSKELLSRVEVMLEPIKGVGEFNHLSVRSAAAIMLDRICGSRD